MNRNRKPTYTVKIRYTDGIVSYEPVKVPLLYGDLTDQEVLDLYVMQSDNTYRNTESIELLKSRRDETARARTVAVFTFFNND